MIKLQYLTQNFLIFLIIAAGIFSCKSTRNISKSTSQDTVENKMDSISVISAEIDSIKSADSLQSITIIDSVDIEVFRIIPEKVSFIGVGDIMMGTNFPDEKYLPPDSGKFLLSQVDDLLKSADVTFGNLEGVILNQGGDPKYCRDPDKCYIFRSPEYMVENLKKAGFNLFSTANNHSGDFGLPGRTNTKRTLDSLEIFYAGFQENPYVIFKKNHLRIGMAAFSPNKGTPQITDIESGVKTIQMLDSLCDIVMVSFHGGAEGNEYMHVTRETETFYGENRGNVYEFSHALIDAGADIVFGHGPHVPRAIELYNDRIIAYSLGNFCTYARFNLRGENAYAPILYIETDAQGKFLQGKIHSAIQTGLGVPIPDSRNRAALLIRELSEQDFPESKIFIEDSGLINYIEQ